MRNRKLNRKSTFVCFIDAKKTFDCVNRGLLWYKLLQLGINGKFLDALKSLYEGTECAVKVNDQMTDFFRVRQGVKQGCKSSPTIFATYINDLASDINALGCGVTIDNVQLAILLYADDIALIAPVKLHCRKCWTPYTSGAESDECWLSETRLKYYTFVRHLSADPTTRLYVVIYP